jgi:Uma2 family endonuclease
MGMAHPAHYTADMVRALPDDGNRYEVVHGELLVTPAPRPWHQVVLERLRGALWTWLEACPVGVLLSAPADLAWGPATLVQPDLFAVDPEEARSLDWARMKRLLLVAEVLSPSTVRADRFTKRRLYQEVGVEVYWAVDADRHMVEVWTPRVVMPVVERERLEWCPAGAGAPFTLPLDRLFRPL